MVTIGQTDLSPQILVPKRFPVPAAPKNQNWATTKKILLGDNPKDSRNTGFQLRKCHKDKICCHKVCDRQTTDRQTFSDPSSTEVENSEIGNAKQYYTPSTILYYVIFNSFFMEHSKYHSHCKNTSGSRKPVNAAE